MNFRSNIQQTIRQMRADFDQLSEKQFNRAVSRILNRVIVTARKEARMELRQRYNLPAMEFQEAMVIVNSNPQNLEVRIKVRGRPYALKPGRFTVQQTKRFGVRYTIIRGQRKQLKHAFVATPKKTGVPLVFMRSQTSTGYVAGQFLNRMRRTRSSGPDLPIAVVRSVSIPSGFKRDTLLKHLERLSTSKFGDLLYKDLVARSKGFVP